MQDELRIATKELDRALSNHEVQSIPRLTALVVLELAKIQLARTPLEAPPPVDPFTPPAGYVACAKKCGRWTQVVTEYGKFVPECWECWTDHGRVLKPRLAAEYPDWTMPEAKPEDVRAGDRMVSADGHVSTVLSVENGYWRMSDPEFPHPDGSFTLLASGTQVPYWTLAFTRFGKSRKLLPRGAQ